MTRRDFRKGRAEIRAAYEAVEAARDAWLNHRLDTGASDEEFARQRATDSQLKQAYDDSLIALRVAVAVAIREGAL